MIRAAALRRTFGDLVAVAGVDLEVAEGEIFGLVGPDGAGKTTTMRMLTGLLPPTGGAAEVAGCDVVRDAERLKEHIGYMSQRFGLYPDLTVMENLDFYADIYGVPARERAARTERLLGFSNLTPFQDRLAGNLSGGMKQKLGLACALIHTPRVLFLDEPTNGVDPVSRRETGSTPLVGSSKKSTLGVWIKAQASPSFCFMPPERLPARRCLNGVRLLKPRSRSIFSPRPRVGTP